MASRSELTKRTFISKIDGKEYVRQLTYDDCYEMVNNQGRLLSEEYKGKNKNNKLSGFIERIGRSDCALRESNIFF